MTIARNHRLIHSAVVCAVIVSIVAFACTSSHDGRRMDSGERILLGNGSTEGPLSAGITTIPLVTVNVFGHEYPDIFIKTGRHSHFPEPGIYLYEFKKWSRDGSPVFRQAKKVDIPDELKLGNGRYPQGFILQNSLGEIYGYWYQDGALVLTEFNKGNLSFLIKDTSKIVINPRLNGKEHLSLFQYIPVGRDSIQIVASVSDGVRLTPPGDWRSKDFIMYDGRGVFKGSWTYNFLKISNPIHYHSSDSVSLEMFSSGKKEVRQGYKNLTLFDNGIHRHLIGGSRYGNLYSYLISEENKVSQRLILDKDGIALRHTSISPAPLTYPDKGTKLNTGLLVGGESSLKYYKLYEHISDPAVLVYHTPVEVKVENAALSPGSLPVITATDIDDDGVLDIVSGNSEGRVLIFKNRGSNEQPYFSHAPPVKVNDVEIHIQPGYSGSVQGPAESRWGYSCPKVMDWNGDGKQDILMSSSLANHQIYLNIGSSKKPKFAAPKSLYFEGLELHGTWRSQPAAGRMGSNMVYITLDDDNEFHMYKQLDLQNVVDGGKLILEDGSTISASYLHAGGTGRAKLVLYDWDEDGNPDLIVGTPRHGSVPNPEIGLPKSKGLKGASVLFLRNSGTNTQPVFEFPRFIRYKGKPIYLGQHSCSPAVWDYGQSGGADLLIGEQDGKIRYYARADLTW